MRSEGQVRFIKVSSRFQLFAAGGVAALLLIWALTLAAVALSSFVSDRDRLSLLRREAQIATSESRLNAYGQDIGKVADDLKRRQTFIESVVDAHLGDLPKDAAVAKPGETVSDSSSEAALTVKKVSLALPQAAQLAQVEAQQLALIEALTRVADRRSAQVRCAILYRGPELGDVAAAAAIIAVTQECIDHLAMVPGANCEVTVEHAPEQSTALRTGTSSAALLPDGDAAWLVRSRARAALGGGRLVCGRAGEGSFVEARFPEQRVARQERGDGH